MKVWDFFLEFRKDCQIVDAVGQQDLVFVLIRGKSTKPTVRERIRSKRGEKSGTWEIKRLNS